MIRKEMKICARLDCQKFFESVVYAKRKFCSCFCANKFNGSQREAKVKRSRAAEEQWQDPGYREKHNRIRNTPKFREKCSRNSRKQWEDLEVKAKLSRTIRELWQNPEYKEKQLKAIFKGHRLLPNRPEKLITTLLQELFPNQWKYIGDGKDEDSIVAGKCPDFIHVSQKKIIEHFGDYHHGEGRTGIPNEQHERERIDYFAQFGYQTLIVWEHELENINVLRQKILEFVEER